MKFEAVISALALVSAATVDAKKTPQIKGVLYARADIRSATGSGIRAKFEFWGKTDGSGTAVKIHDMRGFKKNSKKFQGPFGYHVHTNPVGEARDCSKALGHLDPLHATDSYICNPEFPEYCQHGDLAGKHGKIEPTRSGHVNTKTYVDDYLRFFPESHSILGRSIVIHAGDGTRIACGDIISYLDGTANEKGKPTHQPSTFVTEYLTEAPPNPPQKIGPFPKGIPDGDELKNLPFPVQNEALSLNEAANIVLSEREEEVFINGSSTTMTRYFEEESDEPNPFDDDLDEEEDDDDEGDEDEGDD